ncbi:hypothetical protein F5887DRAFT_1069559 [Amanita rubescens]|nr:hypothetical protein F5887DRAFT_1069559 [Amanita rubescens]
MAYHDPYSAKNHNRQDSFEQHHYSDSIANFNPYLTNRDEHNNYEGAAPYSSPLNDGSYPPRQREADVRSEHGLKVEPVRRSSSGFEQGEFTPHPGKTLRGIKDYRYGNRGNLWAKGSRGHCIGRMCCCTLMTLVFLILSVLLTLALWIRPPNVSVGNVSLSSSNPLQINAQGKQMTINLGVNISVANPNYFSVSFKTIKAQIFYPINNTQLGGGQLNNIVFRSNQQTNISFPFALDYNASVDPNYQILTSLAEKCGVYGTTRSDITVTYKITLGLEILFFVASPVVSNSVSFACPASAQQIQDFLQSLGITNLPR